MMGNGDPIICDPLSYLHGLHGRAVLAPRMNGPSKNCDFGEIYVLTLKPRELKAVTRNKRRALFCVSGSGCWCWLKTVTRVRPSQPLA